MRLPLPAIEVQWFSSTQAMLDPAIIGYRERSASIYDANVVDSRFEGIGECFDPPPPPPPSEQRIFEPAAHIAIHLVVSQRILIP